MTDCDEMMTGQVCDTLAGIHAINSDTPELNGMTDYDEIT